MISKDHKKHSDIARPSLGNFGRNEFSFIGTTCGNVKALADKIMAASSATRKCAYIDASHQSGDVDTPHCFAEYTDRISYKEIRYSNTPGNFQFRGLLNEADLILVNGNHYQAQSQVIIIDKVKENSLLKRVAQITNPVLILMAENTEAVFDFVKEAIPHWQQLPIYGLNETEKIVDFFEALAQQSIPKVNGLVLAGGKSTRMGYDKSAIAWHGKEQKYYMADMLGALCRQVYISCRNDQVAQTDAAYQTIADSFTGLGPYGAILSAFREQPDAAWLVTACDLPLLDTPTLQYLLQNRDASAIATTFESPHDGLPEPLITVWEPKAYPILLSFLAQGYSCPRKVLRNNDVHIITPEKKENLLNVNTTEELEEANLLLKANV
ncbi:NTP transferase domain-containing protein [Foetidibacter luteolus]|uniref:NTP transferase domain-containing protein n=1 Tax=Foetidibacter luteolus TaxID=2608880 RepID=UPI00129AF5A2|nr:NTP transferase domain-containing protein [Foetidibacter luteolus]